MFEGSEIPGPQIVLAWPARLRYEEGSAQNQRCRDERKDFLSPGAAGQRVAISAFIQVNKEVRLWFARQPAIRSPRCPSEQPSVFSPAIPPSPASQPGALELGLQLAALSWCFG